MVRIAVLDSHQLFRLAIITLFEHNPEIDVKGDTGSTTALFNILTQKKVDIVLLSVNQCDDILYMDIARRIRRNYPTVKILAVANEGVNATVQSMMKEGINGYIGKRQAGRYELEKAIRIVASGGRYIGKVEHY